MVIDCICVCAHVWMKKINFIINLKLLLKNFFSKSINKIKWVEDEEEKILKGIYLYTKNT